MSDGKVIVTLSVQDAEAVRAWQRAKQGIGAMQQELKGTKTAANESQAAGQEMVDNLVTGFARMATGALSIQKAVQLVNREYAELVARDKAAGGFQVSLAGAQRAMLRNLSFSEMTPEQAQARIAEIQKRTGGDLAAITDAASDALSARGQLSEPEALTQLEAVVKLDPSLDRAAMKTLTGAALDIRKVYGGTSEQAVGAMLTAQQTARVTSSDQFAMNAVPAMANLSQLGDSFKQASALFSTISQRSADQTGARSGTAMIQFAKQVMNATASVQKLKDANANMSDRWAWLVSGAPEAEGERKKLVGNLNKEYDATQALVDAEDDPAQKAKLSGEAKQYFVLI
ncbi:MAG: hypothetical protein ACREHD_26180, partial [Pirellulales bacterium]